MSLRDNFIRHKIFLQRYIKSDVQTYKKLLDNLLVQVDKAKDNKLDRLRAELQFALGQHARQSISRLNKLIRYETDFALNQLKRHTMKEVKEPVLQDARYMNVVFNTRGPSYEIPEAYTLYNSVIGDKLIQHAKDKQNYTTEAAVGLLLLGGMLSRYEALAGTINNSVASDAHVDVFNANDNLIETVVWDAVLDDATCPDCEDLNGTEFPIGAVEEDCPLHANCRCELVPVLQ